MADESPITPLRVERVCPPGPAVDQLVLKPHVDATERVYERRLMKLNDVSLPDVPSTEDGSVVYWDLYVCLKFRHDWVPSGHGLGDLLYAISLMPNEELTLEVKTWETSVTQQDREETVDIRNVSDIKDTSSAAKDVTDRMQTQTSLHVGASASGGVPTFSASVETDWDKDVTKARDATSKTAQEHVKQTTSEYRATRKVRLTTSREVGSEMKTTRRIRNINRAHTLNANFFEILREYEVTLRLYDRTLVLLGAEVDLTAPIRTDITPDSPTLTYKIDPSHVGGGTGSWGKGGGGTSGVDYSALAGSPTGLSPESPTPLLIRDLINGIRSPDWISWFTNQFGFSPLKKLYELWAQPLYDAALVEKDIADDKEDLKPEDLKQFQDKMLQHVRPGDNWVDVDERGIIRWSYELIPGKEGDGLTYLYGFLPYSLAQLSRRTDLAGMERATAYRGIAARRIGARSARTYPRLTRGHWWTSPVEENLPPTPLRAAEVDKILVPGPFKDVPLSTFLNPNERATLLSSRVEALIIGKLNNIDVGDVGHWTVTLPTQGVYADVALGVCSGAEDAIEVDQQLALQIKRLEVEKRSLEIERLRLQNTMLTDGKPLSTLVIQHPPENSNFTFAFSDLLANSAVTFE
jgi:hypothetical protein